MKDYDILDSVFVTYDKEKEQYTLLPDAPKGVREEFEAFVREEKKDPLLSIPTEGMVHYRCTPRLCITEDGRTL